MLNRKFSNFNSRNNHSRDVTTNCPKMRKTILFIILSAVLHSCNAQIKTENNKEKIKEAQMEITPALEYFLSILQSLLIIFSNSLYKSSILLVTSQKKSFL